MEDSDEVVAGVGNPTPVNPRVSCPNARSPDAMHVVANHSVCHCNNAMTRKN
jgi:hypothetical protein